MLMPFNSQALSLGIMQKAKFYVMKPIKVAKEHGKNGNWDNASLKSKMEVVEIGYKIQTTS
jgi:hypothetical protein